MFGYNNYAPQSPAGYQIQANQNRINELQQYGGYQGYQMSIQPQSQPQVIKGRPVSSYEEAKASMIDLDGSLFVFPDIANKRIYTKQIMLDGTADFKVYSLVQESGEIEHQQPTKAQPEYVLKSDFDNTVKQLVDKINSMKGGTWDEQNTDNVKLGNEK